MQHWPFKPLFNTKKYAVESLNLLQTSVLPCLGGRDSDWGRVQRVQHRLGADWTAEDLYMDFDLLFDRLADIVEQVRTIATLDRETGDQAERDVRANVWFREIWQAIKDSGLFPPDDKRFAAVELFLLAGGFPFEDDAGAADPRPS